MSCENILKRMNIYLGGGDKVSVIYLCLLTSMLDLCCKAKRFLIGQYAVMEKDGGTQC